MNRHANYACRDRKSQMIESSSPVHHRANSGPAITVGLFSETDSNNSKSLRILVRILITVCFPPTVTSSINAIPGSPILGGPQNLSAVNTGSQLWKTRLTNIKNSFLGSPKFHRRKLQSKTLAFVNMIISCNLLRVDFSFQRGSAPYTGIFARVDEKVLVR